MEHTPRDPRAGRRPAAEPDTRPQDTLVWGKNPVTELLKSGRPADTVYLADSLPASAAGYYTALAKQAGAVVKKVPAHKLQKLCGGAEHQGVAARAAEVEYAALEDLLAAARAKNEPPFLVLCDGVEDPHNLGAILRTAECAGAHGVIIPKRRSAGLTAVVAKTSAGAVAHVPVARVPNIPALLKDLKKQGVWVFGTAADGTTSLYDADLKGPAAIVIGSEGDGMTRLAAENCDFLVSIPMRGKLNSLNASAAAAILLYEAVRQRLG